MNNEKLMEEGFSGISNALDTKFELAEEDKKINDLIETSEQQMEEIVEKKNELLINTNSIELKNKDYIEEELQFLVSNTKEMIARLETEIKIGSRACYYDSYAKLMAVAVAQLRELRELSINIVETKLSNERLKLKPGNINNKKGIVLDANSLIELVTKAQQNSEINRINADFVITDEDKK